MELRFRWRYSRFARANSHLCHCSTTERRRAPRWLIRATSENTEEPKRRKVRDSEAWFTAEQSLVQNSAPRSASSAETFAGLTGRRGESGVGSRNLGPSRHVNNRTPNRPSLASLRAALAASRSGTLDAQVRTPRPLAQPKKKRPLEAAKPLMISTVSRDRIELSTRGFSVHCSTD